MPKRVRDNDYSIEHALQRFKERYNSDLTPTDYNQLTKMAREMIKANNNITGHQIMSKRPFNEQWILQFGWNGRTIIPVFESSRDTITTFLPIR